MVRKLVMILFLSLTNSVNNPKLNSNIYVRLEIVLFFFYTILGVDSASLRPKRNHELFIVIHGSNIRWGPGEIFQRGNHARIHNAR